MAWGRGCLLVVLLFGAGLVTCADDPKQKLQRIGTIAHPPLCEASALVKSRKHEGVFWTLNDSGNAPHLFAIDRSGKLIAEYKVKKAPNIDWEAMAQDED